MSRRRSTRRFAQWKLSTIYGMVQQKSGATSSELNLFSRMPLAERRERHGSLFRVLSHNDIQHWANHFLTALERKPRAFSQFEQMPPVGS
jgi:hypothetical protein